MALAHSTYGHPGTVRTTALISHRYCWPTLIKDVRDYVLSGGCRRRKRSASQRVAMLPSRFLRPGEVLEVDIQDMGVKSDAGNKVVLVAVDKASKFLFAFPLPTKEAIGAARKLLKLILTFGLPLYVRSDPGSEFKAEVMQHLCKWLNVIIAYGPADHPRAQGTVETGGVATRSTRRTVQDLASQMGRVCTTGTVDPSYHVGPALTGEANSLPSFLQS